MATQTKNLNLQKPDLNESADIEVINGNMDIIDKEVSKRMTSDDVQALINQAVANLLNGAPEALDTLKELADALGDDPNFAKTILERFATNELNFDKHKADDVAHNHYGDDTGTANAKVVTLSPAPTYLPTGFSLRFKNKVANTDAVTLNINGIGAKPILKQNGNAAVSGTLKAGLIYTVVYNGTSFILQGEGGSGNLQPNQALAGFTFTNDNGEQVGLGDPNLVSENIISGKRIFGVDGSLIPGAAIKSIQNGVFSLASSLTGSTLSIKSVDLTKSIIIINGVTTSDTSGILGYSAVRVAFNSSNVLSFSRTTQNGNTLNISWTVVEFESNVRIQSGTVSATPNSTVTDIAISPVNINRSTVFFSYDNSSATNGYFNRQYFMAYLSTASNLRFQRANSDTVIYYFSWFVLEFL